MAGLRGSEVDIVWGLLYQMTGSSCNRTQLIGICLPKLPAPKPCDLLASGEGPSGIVNLMVPMPSSGVGEKAPDPVDGLLPTLTARIWLSQIAPAVALDVGDRSAVPRPIVALSQAPVAEDRDRRLHEGDPGGLDGPPEIGGKDGLEAITTSVYAELAGLDAPALREPAVPPAGDDTMVVVLPRNGGPRSGRSAIAPEVL